jgi:hypothetical protein
MHAGTVGVEDTGHFDLDPILAVVIKEKGFRAPFSLVVTRPETDGIDASPIGLRLGMDRGIAIDLRSRCLKNPGFESFGKPQHVDGAMNVHLGGLNGVVLIVDRRSRTGQVIDLIDLYVEREGNVVANEFKIRIPYQRSDILLGPRIEIVDTENVVPILEETLAEVGAQESGPSRH